MGKIEFQTKTLPPAIRQRPTLPSSSFKTAFIFESQEKRRERYGKAKSGNWKDLFSFNTSHFTIAVFEEYLSKSLVYITRLQCEKQLKYRRCRRLSVRQFCLFSNNAFTYIVSFYLPPSRFRWTSGTTMIVNVILWIIIWPPLSELPCDTKV